MAKINTVACGSNTIVDRAAAAKIFFGCMVKRSAAGTSTYAVDGNNTRGYEGVACESQILKIGQQGYYTTYDPVSVAVDGVVRVWIVGGGTDVTAGCWLALANDLGCCALNHATDFENGTDVSVAKVLEDQEISNYTTSLTTATAGSKTLTVAATTYFAAGDVVLMDGATGAITDSEIGIIDTIDSATQITLREAATLAQSSTNLRKLVQTKVLLM